MVNLPIDSEQFEELKSGIDRGLASGELMGAEQIATHLRAFSERFGAQVLRGADGEALLSLLHGRSDGAAKCLAYWLEFKNDPEFAGGRFGGIGGGSALKFGVFQRKADGAWVTGQPRSPRVVTMDEAVAVARNQRDQLVKAADVLAGMDANDTSDAAYNRLQSEMDRVAPDLAGSAWAHKYWFLLFSDRLDDYHVPHYQRFHLIKLLQMPPDSDGITNASGPRFVCAGRFIQLARALNVHVSTLNRYLNLRDSAFHSYWRIGTTEGESGESQWPPMLEGGYASIGWPELVPDLSPFLSEEPAALKELIRNFLAPRTENAGTATRKAGEIRDFAQSMAENDIVLACEGNTVRGIGRVTGPYEYDSGLAFPHKRPVEWLSSEEWKLVVAEGTRTTMFKLGRSPQILLEAESRLRRRRTGSPPAAPRSRPASRSSESPPLPALDPLAMRIDGIFLRKGQVILYGPPGTGKTYHAMRVARELAARRAFGRTFDMLREADRSAIGPSGYVRLCTFHPGYGYEDFVEGLRPRTTPGGQMVFEPQDGIFKRLCADANKEPERHFILIIDEINRGDLPRIFGELMTGLEIDKRGVPITLPVRQEAFSIPRNVFLIGTMNTADRSISLLDAALRRRFGFIELMPDSSQLGARQIGGLPLGPWLDALNARVRTYLKKDSRNLQVGHAYLSSRPITSVAEFARVLRDEIVPLLEEYCYDDFETLRQILGPEIVDAEQARIREEIFEANREDELIQAISFPELESLALGADSEDDTAEQSPDDGAGDTE
jgi:5-methylcytosine-specific restriction enzyme B